MNIIIYNIKYKFKLKIIILYLKKDHFYYN